MRLPGRRTTLQYRRADGTWASLPGQSRSAATPTAGTPVRITLPHPVQTDAIRVLGTNRPGSGFGITSLGAWRQVDDNLTAGINTGDDGVITAAPGSTRKLTTRVSVGRDRSTVAADELRVPAGWQVKRLTPLPRHVRRGTTYVARWRLRVPSDFSPDSEAAIRYLVTSTRRGTTAAGDTVPLQWTFDPATFGSTTWDDDFSTDHLADYRLTGALGEPAPTASVDTSAGTLDISSTTRSRGLFRVPTRPVTRMAVIVAPRSFATGSGDGEQPVPR